MRSVHKPSVTALTSILDKPALVHWANRIGLEGMSLDEHRNKMCGIGTSLHKQMENFMRHGYPFEDVEFQTRFIAFMADKEVMAFEKKIETPQFTGRLDIKFEWYATTYICDFKLNQSGVYIENKLQLTAYRMAEGSDKVAIIAYPEMKMVDVGITDFAPYEHAIDLLCQLYPLLKTL